jgi:peptide subunit release factor 1 (eRF1)
VKLDWLKDVALDAGPHVSVYTDATRDRTTGAHDIDLRWAAARSALAGDGAPEPALAALDAVATEPTGVGGPVGRVLLATADGLQLDLVLPAPPAEEATTGPVPHLMPLVRALADDVRYVLVELDRAGADITVTSTAGVHAYDVHSVEGGHDLLHKGSGDNRAEHRYQRSVQDSWDHNAAAVAADLADLVRREHPDVVLLTGDPKAAAALRDKAPVALKNLLRDVKGGGRAAGTHEQAFTNAMDEALTEVGDRRRQAVVDEFAQERGRHGLAVEGLGPVVSALRKGQVRTLLLVDDPLSTQTLWAGPGPLEIGTTLMDLHAVGVQDAVQVRADAALVRALVASDAEIEVVPRVAADEDSVAEPLLAMTDGIGAVLRY